MTLTTNGISFRQLLNATEKENQKLKNYVEKINMSDKDQKEQIKALKTQAAKLIKENVRNFYVNQFSVTLKRSRLCGIEFYSHGDYLSPKKVDHG